MATISREALYEQVWAQPMTKVAASYGVTGTALKKTCKRHRIPTPERGYWARLKHGKTVRQEPLPRLKDASLSKITIAGRSSECVSESVRNARAAALERLATASSAAPDPTAAGPVTPEPLKEPAILAATRRAISKARADAQGFVAIQGPGIVPLRIAPASIDRALSILSRLLMLAESQGYRPRAVDAGLALEINDEAVAFGLEERSQKLPHEPTPADLRRRADYERWGSSRIPWPKYDHVPSGRLALVIHASSFGGLRHSYADRKARALDDLLPEFIIGCVEHAALIKERRAAEGERAHKWRKAEARRVREAAYQSQVRRRMELVDAIHEQLVQRAKLSAVLAHLEGTASEDARGPEAMTAWMRRRLSEIDALISPLFLDISASFAKLSFDDTRADADSGSGAGYRSGPVELQFWSIDMEKEQATSIGALQWAIESGLVPAVDDKDLELPG